VNQPVSNFIEIRSVLSEMTRAQRIGWHPHYALILRKERTELERNSSDKTFTLTKKLQHLTIQCYDFHTWSTGTRLWGGWPGIDSRQGQGFFSLRHRVETGSGPLPPSTPMGTGGKAAGSEADHSPPLRAEDEKAWNYTSILHVLMAWCLVKYQDNFTSTFTTLSRRASFVPALPTFAASSCCLECDLTF